MAMYDDESLVLIADYASKIASVLGAMLAGYTLWHVVRIDNILKKRVVHAGLLSNLVRLVRESDDIRSQDVASKDDIHLILNRCITQCHVFGGASGAPIRKQARATKRKLKWYRLRLYLTRRSAYTQEVRQLIYLAMYDLQDFVEQQIKIDKMEALNYV